MFEYDNVVELYWLTKSRLEEKEEEITVSELTLLNKFLTFLEGKFHDRLNDFDITFFFTVTSIPGEKRGVVRFIDNIDRKVRAFSFKYKNNILFEGIYNLIFSQISTNNLLGKNILFVADYDEIPEEMSYYKNKESLNSVENLCGMSNITAKIISSKNIFVREIFELRKKQ